MQYKKVVSLDLWNTLIRIQKENAQFLSRYLSVHSPYQPEHINKIIKITGRYFDDLAIVSHEEIASVKKLELLINNCNAKIGADQLEQAIKDDLLQNNPVLTEPSSIKIIDKDFSEKDIGWIISSNSGFVSAKIMRQVIDLLELSNSDQFLGVFFSEEIGYAKPSKHFFAAIHKELGEGRIHIHCGDHPVSDYKADLHNAKLILYDPDNQHDQYTEHQKIRSLHELIDHLD